MQQIKEKFWLLPLPLQLAVIILALIFSFGIMGPSMISSNSTMAVWVGIFLLIAITYALWELSLKLREVLK